ncbi:MAG: MATE family efflux transporter [Alphaproteobacteria bacterium]|nr:MATE family efflux transporter [Alphaproteobacteria bacterium]
MALLSAETRRDAIDLIRLAGPISVTFLSSYFITLTELTIIGRLGVVELAAVGLSFDLIVIFELLGIGLLTTLTVLCTQALARGDERRAAVVLRSGILVTAILGTIGMVWIAMVPQLMQLTGQGGQVIVAAKTYVVAVIISIIPGLLGETVSSLASARGPKMLNRVALIWAVGVLVNIPLTWFMVLGFGGVGGWGLTGAGLSRVLIGSAIVACEFYFCGVWQVVMKRKGEFLPWLTWQEFKSTAQQILHQGLPVALSFMFEFTMFVAIGLMIGRFGADWLAANKMVVSVLELAFFLNVSLGYAGMIRITAIREDHSVGLRNRLRRIGLVTLGLAMCPMAVFIVLMEFFPRFIIGFFIDLDRVENHSAIAAAISLFAIAGVFQLADTVQSVSSRLLRGFADTRWPMVFALSGYWLVGIGGGLLVGHYFQLPALLWWALAAGLSLVAALMSGRFWLLSGRAV